MQIEIGQIYTFNKSKTYDIINHIEKGKTKRFDKIWYLIYQIGDLDYFDKKLNRSIIWSKAMPNNEGTCMDVEYMYRFEFEELKELVREKVYDDDRNGVKIGQCVKVEYILIDGKSFMPDGEILDEDNDVFAVNKTPQQMWGIIKNLIG